MATVFSPEKHYGNIEYKQELSDMDLNKINKYATQLKFRLVEGSGTAMYLLGVKDNGEVLGVPPEQYMYYINTMREICKKINSLIYDIEYRKVDTCKKVIILKIKAQFDIHSIFNLY